MWRWQRKSQNRRQWKLSLLCIGTTIALLVLFQVQSTIASAQTIFSTQRGFLAQGFLAQESASPQKAPEQSQETLPASQRHPLPPSLAQWHDPANQGDYFSEVQPTPAGYLIWSSFPVKVYIEPAEGIANFSAGASSGVSSMSRSQAWVEAVGQAVSEWNAYLPLEVISTSEGADITIRRSTPPIQGLRRLGQNNSTHPNSNSTSDHSTSSNPAPGNLAIRDRSPSIVDQLPRIRAAETRYQFYVDRPVDAPAILAHRYTVYLSPNQTAAYTLATARHELGHALGIWGHSPTATDALYFSQVRNPASISVRDINTLKRVYQQSTRLGWALETPPVQSNPTSHKTSSS